jgi:hypothetical protein
VDRHAGRLADREQAGHRRCRDRRPSGDDLAVIIGRDAAHIVMDRRRTGSGWRVRVDAAERSCRIR